MCHQTNRRANDSFSVSSGPPAVPMMDHPLPRFAHLPILRGCRWRITVQQHSLSNRNKFDDEKMSAVLPGVQWESTPPLPPVSAMVTIAPMTRLDRPRLTHGLVSSGCYVLANATKACAAFADPRPISLSGTFTYMSRGDWI